MERMVNGNGPCCSPPAHVGDSEQPMHALVAVIQFTATSDKQKNLDICSGLIRKAKLRCAEMAFLPEGFDYICANSADSVAFAEPVDGPVLTAYRNLAKECRMWLSLGGYHMKDEKEQRSHNSHIVIDAGGDIVSTYRKTHLCVVDIPQRMTIDEGLYCIPGSRILPPVKTPAGQLGLMCCYDLRFPEIAQLLTRQGAEILAYPAAFNVITGVAHWEALLKARAIENQCFVVAAAQFGAHHEKRVSFGHAMIIDPWGTIIAQCQDGPGIAVAEIDLDRLRVIRHNMPVQSHRRHDLYRLTLAPIERLTFSSQSYNFGGHEIPQAGVFYETELSIAFVNHKPVVPGHVLIIPKRCVEKFTGLKHEEVSDVFHVVQLVEKMLEKRYNVTSSNISIQDGFDAGQTVSHVHVHLLPRRPHDFEGDEIYKEMETHDKGQNRKARHPNDMAQEAAEYRQLLRLRSASLVSQ